ncbi:MAG: MFS transporter [Rhizobiales bacterium]|nr:MFS transporter [Hyphomicrobiales bacterium]
MNDTAQQGLIARQAAARLLEDVLARKRAFDEAFAQEAAHGALSQAEPRDRGFARAIAATALRHLGEIDHVLGQMMAKPLPTRASMTLAILRGAAAEILFMDVAQHAAVGTAVEAAGADDDAHHYKSLVNAVLRRLTREGKDLLAACDGPRINTPQWAWTSWATAYGEETARAIAVAHMGEPPLDLSFKPGLDMADWASRLNGTRLPSGTLRLPTGGRIEALDGFADGNWWVQDVAASLPVKLLGGVAGKDVLDLCAAPGGKTAECAAAGAHVTSVDRSAPRLTRLTQNLERLKLSADIVTADAATYAPGRKWDAILLDAPCTATGTARRHPDVLHLKRPTDRDKLAALQAKLLVHAATLLNPGGRLIYCTCSLEAEEGPNQIEAFLASHPGFARLPVQAAEIGGLAECVSPQGDLRSLPCHMAAQGGMDGFFAARLTRLS